MDTRNRQRESRPQQEAQGVAGGGGNDELQDRARALAREGESIIERALSDDSRQFLGQNRQQSGQ